MDSLVFFDLIPEPGAFPRLENLAEVCQKTGLAPLDAKPNNVRRLDALILQGDEVPAPEPNPLFD